MVIPGKIANETKAQFAAVIHRYMHGGASLVGEIKANAESSSAVNRLARESLDESMQAQIADPRLWRWRLELEDIEIMERREALEDKREAREERREARDDRRKERKAIREERESPNVLCVRCS